MKNVWKGLIIGGLTGMAGGAMMDLIGSGAQKAGELGEKISSGAPEVFEHVKSMASDGARKVREVDPSELSEQVLEKFEDSEIPDHARDIAGKAVSKGKELVGSIKDSELF